MVIINSIALVVLFSFVLVYRYIYPKKKINFFFLTILFSLLPVISILRKGTYESGDFNIHIYRAMSFYQNLTEGNILPSWAGSLNGTFGYPLFIFLNPLPYYLQSIFHFLGLSFVTSLKILLAASYILSGIFFYFWAMREVKNSFAAFSGAIVYLFTPYHLLDLHFRVALGEIIVFALLPLFLYALSQFFERKNILWMGLSGISYAFLIFSHQAMAVFSLYIIIPYCILNAFRTNNVIKGFTFFCLPILLGIILSSYTWIPHIIYPKFTLAYLLSSQTVVFPQWYQLLFSPWRFGFLFQGPKGEFSYLIGYMQLAILGGAVYFLIRKTLARQIFRRLFFWVFISISLLFMMTPFSFFIWNTLPILNTTQFATRLLLLLTFSISSTGMFLALQFKKNQTLIIIFIVLTISYTILNWGTRRVIPEILDPTLSGNLSKSTAEGEGFCCMGQPKWTLPGAKWVSYIPKDHIEIIHGEGKIQEDKRTNTFHSYISYSSNPMTVQENTWFFPGWELSINGITVPITYTKKKNPGIIMFDIPAGLHRIVLSYEDLPELKIAKIISVSGFLACIGILFEFFLKIVFVYCRPYYKNLLLAKSLKKRKRKT